MQMEEASDRYKIFMKRLELSAQTDPGAREYLRWVGRRGGGWGKGQFQQLAIVCVIWDA